MTPITRYSEATLILSDARAGADAIIDASPQMGNFDQRSYLASEARRAARQMELLADFLELRMPATRERMQA